jgi:hypothetical protein
MNGQMFDIYRKASESWWKMQQELFDGLYRSAILLFQGTSQAPQAKPPEDHPRSAGATGSRTTKAAPKPGSKKPSHSRKVAGRRAERSGTGNR